MKRKTSLPIAPSRSGLGLPTIMDRDLAAAHGVRYVHLAVYAIDIDRVYWLEPEHPNLPFGWEVFLTQYYLQTQKVPDELLEAICSPLLDETPGEPPLGGQIVFAVYAAAARGTLPATFSQLFNHWHHPPDELLANLDKLHARAADAARELARHCLQAELDPPLAAPTREILERFAANEQ